MCASQPPRSVLVVTPLSHLPAHRTTQPACLKQCVMHLSPSLPPRISLTLAPHNNRPPNPRNLAHPLPLLNCPPEGIAGHATHIPTLPGSPARLLNTHSHRHAPHVRTTFYSRAPELTCRCRRLPCRRSAAGPSNRSCSRRGWLNETLRLCLAALWFCGRGRPFRLSLLPRLLGLLRLRRTRLRKHGAHSVRAKVCTHVDGSVWHKKSEPLFFQGFQYRSSKHLDATGTTATATGRHRHNSNKDATGTTATRMPQAQQQQGRCMLYKQALPLLATHPTGACLRAHKGAKSRTDMCLCKQTRSTP